MGIQLRRITSLKKVLRYLGSDGGDLAGAADVPKGHFAIYVGEGRTRFVVPIAYLEHPSFRNLLHEAEEEYGFDHPNGYLRVPCREDDFRALIFQLNMNL